ncbi:MAG TPA: DedA family protein/thiosulfate sulfurtransferase GlpE [Albitalea sp.]|nr:DedA family protein/thiosulfate sulfurtransferase GlpE [Albitalea sp.]
MRDLIALLVEHGVLIVFVATLAARIGAPVPASPLLVVAGGLAVGGEFSWMTALGGSIVANVIGDGLWFQAGRRHGHRVMRLLCRISLSPDSCVRQSETLITRWGGSSLIAAKFLPGVSVVAAPMAGALGMSWLRFLVYEVVAATIWTMLFMTLGMVFSGQIQQILGIMASTGTAAVIVLLLALAAVLAVRYWRRRSFLREVEMSRISVDDLHELMSAGHAPLVIDVRSEASIKIDGRRIPGALSVELNSMREKAAELPRDRDIILYCNCPNEVSAARGARLLAEAGLARVRPLAGGIDAWVASGRPVVAG